VVCNPKPATLIYADQWIMLSFHFGVGLFVDLRIPFNQSKTMAVIIKMPVILS
jgi:hypothetical protein